MCPHCEHAESVMVSYSFRNGIANNVHRRCPKCLHEWEEDRRGNVKRILVKGATLEEQAIEAKRFASLWYGHQVFAEHNVPDHWHIYVR